MSEYSRYAIYFAPQEGSTLAHFGASWLGWDAALGTEVPHLASDLDVARLSETPRKYGFHGTLKPPFRLAKGKDLAGLSESVAGLASRFAPFEIPRLTCARLGRFFALMPSEPTPEVEALANACVRQLDPFRAPLTEAELAKRRVSDFTPVQEENLRQWGYPYVLEEFRFHLTLTGALEPGEMEIAAQELPRLTKPLCEDPVPVHEICLFGEAQDGRFHILERHPLTA